MAKISRSDWAASVPWGGITDKPDAFGVSDIGQLTGIGYSNDEIPVYDAATGRFKPGTRTPTPSPTPTPTPGPNVEVWVTWDVPALHALQCATEDFDYVGAMPSMPVCVGAPFSDLYVGISASVVDFNVVRITVQNLGFDDLDLGEGQWRLHLFNGL